MSINFPHFAYPQPKEGYWAPVTSTINWCEEDYYATQYSAEIVNTLTNLLFIGLGIKGIRNCLKYDHDSIFLVAFIGYVAVGSGSFAFHSTLKYPMQLVDELSMIYTACLMCYATFSFSRSQVFRQVLGVSLVSLAAFITLYYHFCENPSFHQNAFALITATVLLRSMYIMEVNIRPSLKKKYATVLQKYIDPATTTKSEQLTNARRDQRIVKEMWFLVIFGLSIFLGGFGIWALDIKYCSRLRTWRHNIGLPWGVLLEGHGWWHIMTGIGSYFYIVWAIWLRHCLNERQDEYMLHWTSVWRLPEVVPISTVKSPVNGYTNGYTNGHANGHANGHSNGKTNGFIKGHAKLADRKSV